MSYFAVVYTDGSSRPNPGKAGFGIHGYTYKDLSPRPYKALHTTHHLTNKGYQLPNSKSEENPYELVKPLDVVNISMPLLEHDTNNAAELVAVVYALEHFFDSGINDITIYMDSEYVRRGVTEHLDRWAENNWLKTDGTPLVNKDIWKKLRVLMLEYKTADRKINMLWVKGHDDNAGNSIADMLAAIAANSHYQGHNHETVSVQSFDAYKKEMFAPNDILDFKRLYFNANKSSGPSYYHCANIPKEEGHFGKRTVESVYAILDLSERDRVLDIVMQKHRSLVREYAATATLKLERVLNKRVYWFINKYKENCLYHGGKNNNELMFIDKTSLVEDIDRPGILFKALDIFSSLEAVYSSHSNSHEYTTLDLTDVFYNAGALKPIYKVGAVDVEVPNPFISGKTLALTFNKDMPSRNVLKRIEKLNPTIKLIFWKASSFSYRYLCLVEADNTKALWSNYHTSLFLLPGRKT